MQKTQGFAVKYARVICHTSSHRQIVLAVAASATTSHRTALVALIPLLMMQLVTQQQFIIKQHGGPWPFPRRVIFATHSQAITLQLRLSLQTVFFSPHCTGSEWHGHQLAAVYQRAFPRCTGPTCHSQGYTSHHFSTHSSRRISSHHRGLQSTTVSASHRSPSHRNRKNGHAQCSRVKLFGALLWQVEDRAECKPWAKIFAAQ